MIDNELNINTINDNLDNSHSVEILDSVDSTNDYLKSIINKVDCGHIVISNEQTKGKGRINRRFFSQKDTGIYMSMLIHPNCSIQNSLKITILASVAVFSAIESICNCKIKLKWVNDLILNNLKLGGILCESQVDLSTNLVSDMIVGIGINVKKMIFPSSISNIATSLENEINIVVSRNKLISSIINYFDLYYNNDNLIWDIYKENSSILKKEISVFNNNEVYIAKAIDINKDGCLIILRDNKTIILNTGEVSIRNL